MDKILSDGLANCRAYTEDSMNKYELLLILKNLHTQIEDEYAKSKEELTTVRGRLAAANDKIQTKLSDILVEFDRIDELSDIGIESFMESSQFLFGSLNRIQQELKQCTKLEVSEETLRNRASRVLIDIDRLKTTMKDGLGTKMRKCKVLEAEQEYLKKLMKSADKSIETLESFLLSHKENDCSLYQNSLLLFKKIESVEENINDLARVLLLIQKSRKLLFKKKITDFKINDDTFVSSFMNIVKQFPATEEQEVVLVFAIYFAVMLFIGLLVKFYLFLLTKFLHLFI